MDSPKNYSHHDGRLAGQGFELTRYSVASDDSMEREPNMIVRWLKSLVDPHPVQNAGHRLPTRFPDLRTSAKHSSTILWGSVSLNDFPMVLLTCSFAILFVATVCALVPKSLLASSHPGGSGSDGVDSAGGVEKGRQGWANGIKRLLKITFSLVLGSVVLFCRWSMLWSVASCDARTVYDMYHQEEMNVHIEVHIGLHGLNITLGVCPHPTITSPSGRRTQNLEYRYNNSLYMEREVNLSKPTATSTSSELLLANNYEKQWGRWSGLEIKPTIDPGPNQNPAKLIAAPGDLKTLDVGIGEKTYNPSPPYDIMSLNLSSTPGSQTRKEILIRNDSQERKNNFLNTFLYLNKQRPHIGTLNNPTKKSLIKRRTSDPIPMEWPMKLSDMLASVKYKIVVGSSKEVETPKNTDIGYNERFGWERIGFFQKDYKIGKEKGLPTPLIDVTEYFASEGSGILGYQKQYRNAGYYASYFSWWAFAFWLLSLILFNISIVVGGYTLICMGTTMLLSNAMYILYSPHFSKNPLTIRLPFSESLDSVEGLRPEAWLTFKLGGCFWLNLVGGGACLCLGIYIVLGMKFLPYYMGQSLFSKEKVRTSVRRMRHKCRMNRATSCPDSRSNTYEPCSIQSITDLCNNNPNVGLGSANAPDLFRNSIDYPLPNEYPPNAGRKSLDSISISSKSNVHRASTTDGGLASSLVFERLDTQLGNLVGGGNGLRGKCRKKNTSRDKIMGFRKGRTAVRSKILGFDSVPSDKDSNWILGKERSRQFYASAHHKREGLVNRSFEDYDDDSIKPRYGMDKRCSLTIVSGTTNPQGERGNDTNGRKSIIYIKKNSLNA